MKNKLSWMQNSLARVAQTGLTSCLTAVILSASPAFATGVIAGWTFETSQPGVVDLPASPGAGVWITNIAAEAGSGTASGLHAGAATYSSPAGNGSSHSFSANTWAAGDCFQFVVSGLGVSHFVVSFQHNGSATGPRDFNFQYSTDGVNFTTFSSYELIGNGTGAIAWAAATPGQATVITYDLGSVTALNGAANVYFRLTCADTTALGSGSTFGTGGTSRVDNFVVYSYSLTPFTAGNLAVLQTDAGGSQNSSITILELSPSTANQSSPVNFIPIPANGAHPLLTSGSAGTTGMLADSSDGSLLTFGGMVDGNSANTQNENATTARAAASLNMNDTLNFPAAYTGTSGNQVRSATSPDDSTWYVGDQGGIYLNGASSAANPANIRSLRSFGGTVYELTAASNHIIASVSADGTALTGLPGIGADGKAVDFYMISSGNNGTYDTLYYLVQTNATSGIIKKYSLVSGTWTANNTYSNVDSSGFGFGGDSICAASDGSGGAYLYITSADGGTTTNGVYALHDAAGYNANINITSASNVKLYTAPAGATLKGIAFAPKSSAVVTTPVITAIQINSGNVLIDFTGGASDVVGNFTVLGTTNLSLPFSPVAASITTSGPGLFRATILASAPTAFYKIRH